jgi:hypothetical protein
MLKRYNGQRLQQPLKAAMHRKHTPANRMASIHASAFIVKEGELFFKPARKVANKPVGQLNTIASQSPRYQA